MGRYIKQNGQSLIEVLIALSVTVIIMVALIAFVLTGLKNAQLAQNQSKATKLAVETMEQIKSIRDRDGIVMFTDSGGVTTSKFPNLWVINMSNSTECNGSCYFNLNNFILTGSYADSSVEDTLENRFTRQIIFEDTDTDNGYQTQKKITVKVKWTDSTGEHESNIQTILTPVI